MKKNLSIIVLVILAVCLVGFAIDRFVPASPVSAASEAQPAASSASHANIGAVPPAPTAQPVIFVVAGLVCVLFGILAVSPLLTGDPDR